MKPVFQLAIFCGTAALFPAFSCLAQDSDEDEVIKGPQFPRNFIVPKSSVSPDGRYGVLAPADWDHYDENGKPQNKLVEIKSGRVLATINAETGLVHMNHGGILPAQWSADNSYLIWTVDGKWSFRALVLLKIDNGEVKWQRDLLKEMQREILARTGKAAPQKYAAAKKENAGNGSAYPDGFTISVKVGGEENAPITFPLALHAELESNPKAIEDYPKSANVTAEIDATMDSNGKLAVKEFHLGLRNPE
ncbi:MAG TPA: hypothetical protein VH170_04520 [Chthoniobacterales bacterium]|nr:hypothetical protein [Chthoniobacterales bacterium]